MGRAPRTSARDRRTRRPAGFARFFTKQLLLFVALALLIVVIDFFLYAVIAYRESNSNFNDGTPASTTRAVDQALEQDADGSWTLGENGLEALGQQDAWALVIGTDGAVAWSQDKPEDVPDRFSVNDVAMAAHYAAVADYPAFFWDRDDGLLVVGFPKNEFWTMTLTYPASTVRNFPLYVLLIFAVDLGILYTIYAVSRRRTQNAVAPIAEALDALSDGRAAELHLKGDLRDIGDQITETSAVIEQKDAARASWIRGISHDIRTPQRRAQARGSSERRGSRSRTSSPISTPPRSWTTTCSRCAWNACMRRACCAPWRPRMRTAGWTKRILSSSTSQRTR